MKPVDIDLACLLIGVVIAISSITYYAYAYDDCHHRGGVLVQWQCVQPR